MSVDRPVDTDEKPCGCLAGYDCADSPTPPDPREPKPCPRCGTVCTHDGWGHVHPNGIGIGS